MTIISPKVVSNLLFKRILTIIVTIVAPIYVFAQSATGDVIEPPKEFDPTSWDWVSILIWVLIALIVLVIARAFDIGGLAESVTGKKIASANRINAWVGIIVLVLGLGGVFWEISEHGKYLLLWDAASEHGSTIDSMFMWTFGITFVVFLITEFLLFYFMFRYQYNENRKAHYYFHNNKLEMIWTIVPAIVLTFLVLRGFDTWTKITYRGAADSEDYKKDQEIEVFAYQFGWKARYAGNDNKFGEANFNFISGSNPLGVAVGDQVDSLVVRLNTQIAELEAKMKSVNDSAKLWQSQLDKLNASGLAQVYTSQAKSLREKLDDINSGAYEGQIEKDLRRKQTNLKRIAAYRAMPAVFNNAGNDDKVTTEIVLIKNKPYRFKFRARDVIHSAYAPEFRLQMNCVPGMSTVFPFVPSKTTAEARKSKGNPEFDYYLYCNKICGAAHYNMKIKITVVENEAEFNTWLASQAPIVAPAVVETPAAPATTDSTAKPTMAIR